MQLAVVLLMVALIVLWVAWFQSEHGPFMDNEAVETAIFLAIPIAVAIVGCVALNALS